MQHYELRVFPIPDSPYVAVLVKTSVMVFKANNFTLPDGTPVSNNDISQLVGAAISVSHFKAAFQSRSKSIYFVFEDRQENTNGVWYIRSNGTFAQAAVSEAGLQNQEKFTLIAANPDYLKQRGIEPKSEKAVDKDQLIELTKRNLQDAVKEKDAKSAMDWLSVLIALSTKVDF